MRDAIGRLVHFIAWGNFVRPGVYVVWAESLALLGVVVWVALATGDLLRRDDTDASATETLVMTCATGLALWAVVLFALAAVHAYRPAVVAGLAIVPIGMRRSLRPWHVLTASLREEPWLWLLFLACSMSALLPPWRWDETAYHLAQAEQWVQVGGLTVDPYLRYPLNVCNWQLLQGVALMMRSDSLVHLMTWWTGALAALTIRLFLQRLDVPSVVSYPAAVAFFVTPLVQGIVTAGLIDVPLMFWLTVSVYALFRFRTPASAALCAAMFLGMKITAVLFVPLFVGLALYRLRGRSRLVYLAVLVLASAPWYVRNVVRGGDPIPPVLGQMLHQPSRYWSDWDRTAQAADLHQGLSWRPAAIASLPAATLASTEDGPLRGSPLLGYILVFPFSILMVSRLRRLGALEPLLGAWYGAVVWIATSYHLRYAMFLPLAVVAAAYTVWVVVGPLMARRRWTGLLASIGLLIGPTPAAAQYIKNDWARPIPAGGHDIDGVCLGDSLRVLTGVVSPPARLYLVNLSPLKYGLEQLGYRAIGDDFHDGRWTDFWHAVDARRPGAFLASLPVDYVVACRDFPAERAVQWRVTTSTLAGDSLLVPLVVDSVSAVFRIRR